jgi:hypothetical protein
MALQQQPYRRLRTLDRLTYALSWFAIAIIFGVAGGFAWQLFYDASYPPTTFGNVRIIGDDIVKTGSSYRLAYDVERWQSCRLDISRLLERESDHREFQALGQDGRPLFVSQIFDADPINQATGAPTPRPSGYQAWVPANLEVLPGHDYEILLAFSSVRYRCSWLDEMRPSPRILITTKVRLRLVR